MSCRALMGGLLFGEPEHECYYTGGLIMWIFTLDGFFSVVAYAEHPGQLVVRARYPKDLKRVARKMGRTKIWHTPLRDYPYRLYVGKGEWASYVAETAKSIDYTNFKDASLKGGDFVRSHQYHEVWATMADTTPFEPETEEEYYGSAEMRKLWGIHSEGRRG